MKSCFLEDHAEERTESFKLHFCEADLDLMERRSSAIVMKVGVLHNNHRGKQGIVIVVSCVGMNSIGITRFLLLHLDTGRISSGRIDKSA